MALIEFEDGAVQVEATVIAGGLTIEPSLVQERMREGKITSLCERGIDEDQGRYRLTFFFGEPAFSPPRRREWERSATLDTRLL